MTAAHAYLFGVCLCGILQMASAEDGINWATVALAWALSLITTCIVLAVTLVVLRAMKRRRKVKKIPPRITRELSVVSDASHLTSASDHSTNPLYKPNGGGAAYKRVPSRESTVNRRTSDFVSQWCSKYGLTEVIAANLRENGFNSQKQLDSLSAGDVMTLGLPNVAQQVQLRGVLETLRKKREQEDAQSSAKPTETQALMGSEKHRRSSSSERSRTRSSTQEEVSTTTPSPKQVSVVGSTHSSFPYNSDRCYAMPSNSHMTMPAHVTEELPYDRPPHHSAHHLTYLPPNHARSRRPRLTFHGLLSDSGLYELAESLGTEWRHLAAVLGVAKAQQDHILNDNPNNTKQQIYEMLRHWRDSEKGEKEEIKAVLNEGFKKIKRKDLADRVLREQVHGSDEHLSRGSRVSHSVV